ncbi:NAD(P)-dependent oxidoreductase [Vibrio hepatarius]|uniref:NAD(P)-dependent oxidoreductase n=1 Tax=Vibrio hepatarius TaxID=171383 RepID=UPI001C09B351|nr:NAD(P)-dependent oxidoreductase [Vibrio hepatarius]MBU2898114.1 NAD(P)-dependent oxidoreductase [Vibrio hepatarius]
MKVKKVAFIGLGVMGYPMAGHLANAGFETRVYNRTQAKAEQWVAQYQGEFSSTPIAAAEGCDIVAVCVGNDDDVRSVVLGDEGVLAAMQQGTILVDHTTTSAELAQELSDACDKKGVYFIDAPVSGGQAGAENGSLTIMCGGKPQAFDIVSPLFDVYAKQAVLLGENGQGQRCKMVNQICIAGILQGLSEGLQLAQSADLDIEKVANVLKHGAAGSWQMENRAVTMSQGKFDFGFAIDWMRKDLGICLNEAKSKSLMLPMTKEVDDMYASLQEQGLGRMDTSVLIQAYKK